MKRTRPRRRGQFRLIELFVLITIVCVVLAAIPVAWHLAHAKSRQDECLNNMRNVAQAVNSYELMNRQYPGYSNVLKLSNGQFYSDPATGKPRGVSYVIPLLSYIDLPVLERLWKEPTPPQNVADPRRVEIMMLVCPGDRRPTGACPLSYVVNCAMPDIPGSVGTPTAPGVSRDWAANGVFFDLFTGNPLLTGAKQPLPTVNFGNVSDDFGIYGDAQPGLPLVGMSNDYVNRVDGVGYTCMLSENVDAGQYTDDAEAAVGIVWDGSGKVVDVYQDPPHLKPPSASMAINAEMGNAGGQPSTAFARPSSYHYGGVNMAFCDGRVRFVSDQMDYYVYCLLMSSNGSKVKLPGSTKVLPNLGRPLVESWYLK